MRSRRIPKFALCAVAALFTMPAVSRAQSITITCVPVDMKSGVCIPDYWVWGTGKYTYTPSGDWKLNRITEEYGTLDEKGNFKLANMGGPFQVIVAKDSWDGKIEAHGVMKGGSIWIRARLEEINSKTNETRIAAEVVSKYTAPTQ